MICQEICFITFLTLLRWNCMLSSPEGLYSSHNLGYPVILFHPNIIVTQVIKILKTSLWLLMQSKSIISPWLLKVYSSWYHHSNSGNPGSSHHHGYNVIDLVHHITIIFQIRHMTLTSFCCVLSNWHLLCIGQFSVHIIISCYHNDEWWTFITCTKISIWPPLSKGLSLSLANHHP